jgi:hypothetical protein
MDRDHPAKSLVQHLIEALIVLGHRGTETTVDLQGKLYARDGRVQFDPVAGRIGAQWLPQCVLISAMHQALSEPEQRDKLQLPPNISDLRVETKMEGVSLQKLGRLF